MKVTASDYYLLRVPALPIAPAPDQLANYLQTLWTTGLLAEAVFVASPALHHQISRHLAEHGWPLPASLARPLWKYGLRMSTRATPFGLMAGCSMGIVTDATRIERSSAQPFIRHQRLDMHCLAVIARQIVDDPGIRPQLCFYPNNTHYAMGNELRYVEREESEAGRHYFVSSVTFSPYLDQVLQAASGGGLPAQLIKPLTEAGFPPEEALPFIDQLIDQQVLISEAEPLLTGPSMIDSLLSLLQKLEGTEWVVKALTEVQQALNNPDLTAQAVEQTVRSALAGCFTDLPSQLIQTDVFINTPVNAVSRQVVDTLTTQLKKLIPLSRPLDNPLLTDFVRRFRERYDQQEVSLQEVLDGEWGIGYGAVSDGQADYLPLLDGLILPQNDAPASINWGAYEKLLLTKLSDALRGGTRTVPVTDEDLKAFDAGNPDCFPASFYLFGNLLGASADGLDRGEFRFNVLAAEGPSAANLMGRFCAYSDALTGQVRASLRREEAQRPDALYAEIVHWANDRLGNVLVRPQLRLFEIPYLSRASADEAHQLPLSDLFISLQPSGRILLRSRRHNKEVIPRLSTAHNYRLGLSTYQFLADLARQDEAMNFYWNWGPLRDQPFLPEITYGNLILSRARWSLPTERLPTASAEALAGYLQAEHQLPDWVALADGDNELVLDIRTEAGQQLLLEEARRQTVLRLVEWVATPDQCWVSDANGQYVNELIIPCETEKNNVQAATAKPVQEAMGQNVVRSFEPGSEWLYVKLYCGLQTADELLKRVVRPLVEEIESDGLAEQGFFVRYADPEPHIRLRFRSDQPQFPGVFLERLNAHLAPFRQWGTVRRIQLDTYERELERYGRATMPDSERLFSADTRAVLAYLSQETDLDDRWRFALQSCDGLLADFGLATSQKVALMRQLQEQFLDEHKADRALRQELNARFRERQKQIFSDLAPDDLPRTDDARAILTERSRALQPIAGRIREKLSRVPEGPGLTQLVASYLHMAMNRLFTSQQRTQEMVIYHFLCRYYESLNARQMARAQTNEP